MRLTHSLSCVIITSNLDYLFLKRCFHESIHGICAQDRSGIQCAVSLAVPLNLPQTAFDILLFLANNPECDTASDIVELRKIKANLVSVNVNRLVEEGYLRREPVPGDRRKTRLLCTKQAQPIIDKGRALQAQFAARLLSGMSERQRQAFADAAAVINHNLDEILQEVH